MYKSPERMEMATPKGFRRWFWPQQDYARLQREFASFRVELELLEARSQQLDKSWTAAAHDQLDNVAHYLKKKDVDIEDVEGGWVCLQAARRYAIHGLDPKDLSIQASILRAEASKFLSWRAKEMQNLLSLKDEQLTASHITSAMVLRDEYFSNQYYKIWLTGQQLAILLTISVLGLFLLTPPLVVFYSRHPDSTLAPWGYQMVMAVLFFGLLGAAFSAAGSLMNAGADARVPERVANGFVTSARALFGAAAGLAGYAFYQSKVLDIRVGVDCGPSGALAVAFLFGFAGEQLITHVLGALGARK